VSLVDADVMYESARSRLVRYVSGGNIKSGIFFGYKEEDFGDPDTIADNFLPIDMFWRCK
jgi:hypothetical protein